MKKYEHAIISIRKIAADKSRDYSSGTSSGTDYDDPSSKKSIKDIWASKDKKNETTPKINFKVGVHSPTRQSKRLRNADIVDVKISKEMTLRKLKLKVEVDLG